MRSRSPGDDGSLGPRATRGPAAAVTLRPLTGDADVDAINHVVASTWGGQYLEREVVRALCVSGNVPWGAEAGGSVIGFVLGWAGVDEGGLHVHSHMLASVPDRRHAGVGYALKLAQRAQALDQGIAIMRWTFDPMVARNAWFNLGKLGVVVDRFERSFYGEMQDAINAGDRSDRFTVRWDLPASPVRARSPRARDRAHPARVPRATGGGTGRSLAAARRSGPFVRGAPGRWSRVRGLRSGDERLRLRPSRGHAVTRVRSVELRLIGLPLVRPFRTSFGTVHGEGLHPGPGRDRSRRGLGGVRGRPRTRLRPRMERRGVGVPVRLPDPGAAARRRPRDRGSGADARVRPRQPHGEGHADRRVRGRGPPRTRGVRSQATWAASPTVSPAACRWASPRPRTSCDTRSTGTSRRGTGASS